MRKPTILFPNRSDTNLNLQAMKKVRGWKFEEELYYLCKEESGADHLCSYRTADLQP